MAHVVPIPADVLAFFLRETGARIVDAESGQLRGSVTELSGKSRGAPGGWQQRVREENLKAGLDPWQLRDLRRTCASGLARTGTTNELIGLCLGHAPVGITRKVYQRWERLEERREALARWARHVEVASGCSDVDADEDPEAWAERRVEQEE